MRRDRRKQIMTNPTDSEAPKGSLAAEPRMAEEHLVTSIPANDAKVSSASRSASIGQLPEIQRPIILQYNETRSS
jgi:hypothetical protein